jgi:transcription elongation factor GreA
MDNQNNGTVYLTRDRLLKIESELLELKRNGRVEMAGKIAEARAHGDLSENAEYDAAKEAQQHLELKINKLEQILIHAQVIESKDLPNDKIYIFSRVKLLDKQSGEEVVYILVSQEESNFEENKISITSPIGKGLIGKKQGDEVKIPVPAGYLEYKILELSR